MKHATIQAHGIIPVFTEGGTHKILLVEQYGAQGTHWGFPKGKVMPGESPLECAKREAKEEVGIAISDVVPDVYFGESYSFTYEDTIVNKDVTYFIGFTKAAGFALQASEVKNARWCTFEEALALLTYSSTKQVLEGAIAYLARNHA